MLHLQASADAALSSKLVRPATRGGRALPLPWFAHQFQIFASRIRGIASGVSAMTAHSMLFILVKLYVKLETIFTTANMFLIYALVAVVGTFYLHFQLPETENKSLEEIEKSFQRRKDNDTVELRANGGTKEHEYPSDALPNWN